MTFKLILLVIFILFEPFLAVKAFWWSNITYQLLLWILILSLFDWSRRDRSERLVFAGMTFAIFFRPAICGLTFPWSNSFYLLLISATFLISFVGRKDLVWRKTYLDIPILSFLTLATGYMLISIDRMDSLRQVVSLWGAGIFYFILVRELKDPSISRKMILVFLMAGLRIMANGLHQLWIGLTETRIWIETYTQGEIGARLLTRLGSGRVFSNFVYPNAYAGFLIMVIPVIFCYFFQVKGYKRIGMGSLLGLSFFSLYLTYSKGGWLTLALISLLAFVFLFPRFRVSQRLFIISLFFILIFCLVITLESTGSGKLGFTKSFKARWEYWQATFCMLRDNPFRGYGLGNFGEIYARYKLPMAEETQMVHNNYLQVWVEMGILGFIILLWFVFNFLKIGLSNFKGDAKVRLLFQGAFFGGIAFFIHSLVDFDFYVPNLLFSSFFLIGVMVALSSKANEYILLKNPRQKVLYCLLGIIIFLGLSYNQARYLNYLFTLEIVNNFITEKNSNKAEEELEELIEEVGFSPRLHFEKGQLNEAKAFKEKSSFTRAIYEYNLASNLNPHRASYHFSLGRLYWSLRDNPCFLKKAISEFNLACEAYPTKKEYRKVLEDIQQYLKNEK